MGVALPVIEEGRLGFEVVEAFGFCQSNISDDDGCEVVVILPAGVSLEVSSLSKALPCGESVGVCWFWTPYFR